MGLLKWLLKHFKCNSKCSFNDEFFDDSHLNRKLSLYSLKNKDIQRILKILHKRDYKEEFTKIII